MATYIVAPERPDGTRATYDSHRPSDMFDGIQPWNIKLDTPTKLIFTTPAGNRLILIGTGFVFDENKENPWNEGTINSIELWNQAQSIQYAAITGLTTDLFDFGHQLQWGSGTVFNLLFDGDDTLLGGQSEDRFRGLSGDDSISGGGGDDLITPGAGNDIIDGGEGFNSIEFWDYQPTDPARTVGITFNLGSTFVDDPWGGRDYFTNIQQAGGTSLDDVLIGSNVDNWLGGGAGDDQLLGMGGDDVLQPDQGDDVIDGGEGWDMVDYENAKAAIVASLHTGTVADAWGYTDSLISIERLRSTNYADSISGSAGNDTFQTLGGADTVVGGAGVDTVNYNRDYRWAGDSGVTVNLATKSATDGFGAKDSISEIENVVGTQFSDTITGDASANLIIGNAGTDNLNGGTGDDTLDGGEGGDVLRGGAGNDTAVFSGSKGNYTYSVGAGGALIVSGTETDLVYETESFRFADGIFTLSQLLGEPSSPPPPVVVTPQPPVVTPPATVEATASTTLSEGSLNLVAGGTANISLTGNALDNSITGNKGKNTINGGAGSDKVNGGLGNDNLTGGSGKDAFLFTSKLGTAATDRKVNFDTITDFKPKEDKLYLDNAIFKKLGTKGTALKPAKLDKKFFSLDKAKDKGDYIVYNKKTGVLSYDADGSGKGQAVEFALLKNKAALKVDDFFVI